MSLLCCENETIDDGAIEPTGNFSAGAAADDLIATLDAKGENAYLVLFSLNATSMVCRGIDWPRLTAYQQHSVALMVGAFEHPHSPASMRVAIDGMLHNTSDEADVRAVLFDELNVVSGYHGVQPYMYLPICLSILVERRVEYMQTLTLAQLAELSLHRDCLVRFVGQ